MPIVELCYKHGRNLDELVIELAEALPGIVAPQLDVVGRPHDEGMVTEKEIVVQIVRGSQFNVNVKDLKITIWAHNFPERVETDEERKDAIVKGVRNFLADYDHNVEVAVLLILVPIALGTI